MKFTVKTMSKIVKTLIMLTFSVMIALIFNYNFTMELVRRFVFIPNRLQLPLGILSLLTQVAIFFMLIKLIISKEIDFITLKIIWICYFSILVFILFGRPIINCSMNLNPFAIFYGLNNLNGILIALFNIIFFIPIGALFRRKKITYMLIVMLPVEFMIESIQYLFKLGTFDIDDIILNMIGVYIGFIIFRNFEKIKIIKSNNTIIK